MLVNDPTGISEVVNDIDGRLTNFWRVLQGEDSFSRFARVLVAMPFSEAEWRLASKSNGADAVEDAVRFFVHCRQSLAGRMNGFAPLSRMRTRRGVNEQASAWLNAVAGLADVYRAVSSRGHHHSDRPHARDIATDSRCRESRSDAFHALRQRSAAIASEDFELHLGPAR